MRRPGMIPRMGDEEGPQELRPLDVQVRVYELRGGKYYPPGWSLWRDPVRLCIRNHQACCYGGIDRTLVYFRRISKVSQLEG